MATEHVAKLREAVAELLEFATVRDAAVACLLDAIADAIESARTHGTADVDEVVVERALAVADRSDVNSGIDWHRHRSQSEVPP